jgi:thioredoxin 1
MFFISRPLFHQKSTENESVQFLIVDVDELEDIASEVGVSGVPSFAAFKDGQKQDLTVGSKPELIDQVLCKLA